MKLLTERKNPIRSIAIPLYKLFIRFRDKTSSNLDTRTIASFPRVNQGKMQINFHSDERKTLFPVSKGALRRFGSCTTRYTIDKRLRQTSADYVISIQSRHSNSYTGLPKRSRGKNSTQNYLPLNGHRKHPLKCRWVMSQDRIALLPYTF